MDRSKSVTLGLLRLALVLGCTLGTILVAQPAAAAGSTYYVATNGNDSASGTLTEPWRTMQKAANTVSSGGTVIVMAGDYSAERVQVTRSGIAFQAQGTVVMKGFTVTADNTSIIGFEITGAVHSDWREGWGINVKGKNCRIEDNYVYYSTDGGIALIHDHDPHQPEQTTDCIVKNNRLYQNSQVGIEVHGRRHIVEGNEIWGTIQYHPMWTSPWADADGIRFFGEGHVFRNNYVHDIDYDGVTVIDSHTDCLQTWGDTTHEVAKNSIIEQNLCWFKVELGAPDAPTKGVQLHGASGLVIRNNIFRGYHGIMFINGSSYNTIVNNTFISSLTPIGGGQTQSFDVKGSPNNTIRNNIIYDVMIGYINADSSSETGLNAGGNLVCRSDGGTLRGSAYPGDLWGVDPMFVDFSANDFHLQTNSPAINAGLAMASVTNAFDGVSRPQDAGYDIGAYEYDSGPSIPTDPDKTWSVLLPVVRRN